MINSNDDPDVFKHKDAGQTMAGQTEFLTFHINVVGLCMDNLQSFMQIFAHRDGNLHILLSSNFQTLPLLSASSNNSPLNNCVLLHCHGMTQKKHVILHCPVDSSLAVELRMCVTFQRAL